MAGFANSTLAPCSHQGPVTRAIAAMRKDEPPRRTVLGAISAALVGSVFGVALNRPSGPDLAAVAAAYIDDCRAVGIFFTIGPDGLLWQGGSITNVRRTTQARADLLRKLAERPRLRLAVAAAVRAEGIRS